MIKTVSTYNYWISVLMASYYLGFIFCTLKISQTQTSYLSFRLHVFGPQGGLSKHDELARDDSSKPWHTAVHALGYVLPLLPQTGEYSGGQLQGIPENNEWSFDWNQSEFRYWE